VENSGRPEPKPLESRRKRKEWRGDRNPKRTVSAGGGTAGSLETACRCWRSDRVRRSSSRRDVANTLAIGIGRLDRGQAAQLRAQSLWYRVRSRLGATCSGQIERLPSVCRARIPRTIFMPSQSSAYASVASSNAAHLAEARTTRRPRNRILSSPSDGSAIRAVSRSRPRRTIADTGCSTVVRR